MAALQLIIQAGTAIISALGWKTVIDNWVYGVVAISLIGLGLGALARRGG